MNTISAEQARANIIAAYTKEHQAGVNALSSAIDRVRGARTEDKTKAVSDLKPSLAELLSAGSEE